MSPYALNKTVSVSVPVLFLLVCLWWTDSNNPALWWLLLIVAHTLGYTHFILGYIYQYKSLKRNPNKNLLAIFFILTFSAVLFVLLFILSNQLALLAVIAIGYFITHGVLNEVTQMKEFMGYAPRLLDMLSLVFYLLTFFLLSLTHPSFLFGPDLVFSNPNPEQATWLLGLVISPLTLNVLLGVCVAAFFWLLPGRLLMRGNYLAGSLTALVGASTLAVFFWLPPVSYIVLYFIALSYHFISWGVFIWQKYRVIAPERVRGYILAHVYVLLPFVIASAFLFQANESVNIVHAALFNGIIFIVMTMIHNTTSFLNEDWFKKLIQPYV